MRRRIIILAIVLAGSITGEAADWPTEKVGGVAVWDAAYDQASGVRFIPLQLIVPGRWSGARAIDYPPGGLVDAEGDRWSGPAPQTEALTGRAVTAYTRERTTRREGHVLQLFAVRQEEDGLGRIADSRFGGLRCAGEIKFPLGEWRQGETRRNEFLCSAAGRDPVGRLNVITIEKIDFPCQGVRHCLQFTWTHFMAGRDRPLDDRRYVFAPGLGMVAHERR